MAMNTYKCTARITDTFVSEVTMTLQASFMEDARDNFIAYLDDMGFDVDEDDIVVVAL
ncbi:hypothetical protein EVB87_060 [Rhizobium phage RHph_N28_1]|nr:hypothetical protein EVB87_060 [Rhizobium phage RHph_N28_1]QIG74088.1 hypothetical protein EVC07_060 [Rhizobium phage RHph_N42]